VGRFSLLLCGLGLAVGCAEKSEPPEGPATDVCAPLHEECFVNQQVCAVTDGAPACQACAPGQYAAREGVCKPLVGTALSHDFPDNTTPAGGESLDLCRSWTVGNAEELYVNAVETTQDEASHHSNWTFVPDTEFAGPDGIWPCDERNYSQLSAAVAGGVLYAQSTQATHEVQKFPDGVVIRVPANARIISSIHTLNTTDAAVTGHMRLTIYALDPAEVTVTLAPFHLSYDGLALPPQSQSRFAGECELDSQFREATGAPFAPQVYYVLPHTHALGRRMFIETYGGERDGEMFFDVLGFNGEARGRAYDPPIDMNGALGMRFGCEFDNPRTETVVWGFGDKEMCEVLGFAASPLAFESRIETAEPADATDMPSFTGACDSIVLPWDK
jgi:hypothetical protein